jgi:alpha-beta hydrolase superfamily lysophospholipase
LYIAENLNFRISCPILVFHAQDDHIIPVKLGQKLVESARLSNRTVKYVEFDASRKFLHKYIHRAKELPEILVDFFSNAYDRDL